MICQSTTPAMPWLDPRTQRLPGLRPVPAGRWLLRDECFEAQRALRQRLVAERRAAVFACLPEARPAAAVLAGMVFEAIGGSNAGAGVADEAEPLIRAGLEIQEDLLILTKNRGEPWRLTAGLLCFPASWTLTEKIGRTISAVHRPVASYDPALSGRMDRIFDHLTEDKILCRANSLVYSDPVLFHPLPEGGSRRINPNKDLFIRIERQTLRRIRDLPAFCFAIHTYFVPARNFPVWALARHPDADLLAPAMGQPRGD